MCSQRSPQPRLLDRHDGRHPHQHEGALKSKGTVAHEGCAVEAAKYAFHELKLLAKIYQETGRFFSAYKGPTLY
jgi:hypothetical protein